VKLRLPRKLGSRVAVARLIRQLPNFVRLLGSLFRDVRVSKVDKTLVAFAVAYVLSPLDLVPDVLGFFGLADDVFLLSLVLNRLIDRAGPKVLRDHWKGSPDTLALLVGSLRDAGTFLPDSVRKLLQKHVHPAT
jgi:uncharacterized membrane protein YkvA (DUF1232 family)